MLIVNKPLIYLEEMALIKNLVYLRERIKEVVTEINFPIYRNAAKEPSKGSPCGKAIIWKDKKEI